MQVYVFSCARTNVLYLAEPPAAVPLAALLSQAASLALGSAFPLPLDPLFAQGSQALSSILFPSSGASLVEQHASQAFSMCPSRQPQLLPELRRQYCVGWLSCPAASGAHACKQAALTDAVSALQRAAGRRQCLYYGLDCCSLLYINDLAAPGLSETRR